jgi:hypothetical protein
MTTNLARNSGGGCQRAEPNAPHEPKPEGAATSTVEALMFGLREGIEALPTNPERLRRLSELSAEQLCAACGRLQNFKPEIAAAWASEEIEALMNIWSAVHGH